VTYNKYDATNTWAAGARGAGDCVASRSGWNYWPATTGYKDIALLNDDIEGFINGGLPNYGHVLTIDDNLDQVRARAQADGTRPKLTVNLVADSVTKIIALIRDRRLTETPGEIEFSIEWSLSVSGQPNGTVPLIQNASTQTDHNVLEALKVQLAAFVSGVTGQPFVASDVRGLYYGAS
jgi:hypothetical protein